jgi:hypothetical protein
MKRHCLVAVLMLLSSPADAGNSISFVVGGHRIHIEASRYCRSLKSTNTLRVEACAFGRFYCSGNNWRRIVDRPESLMSSRQGIAGPRS